MHEKYTYKKGKKYGPYLYTTKRVDGKIVTTYLGRENQEGKNHLFLAIVLVILTVAIIAGFFWFSYTPTGRVALDIKPSYTAGETISGNLELTLQQGELLPLDTEVVFSLGSVSKTLFLKDLVLDDSLEGDFYASGIDP